ncbi:hypothetical protein SO802_004115 [Lithocarpus litseifolius]|uniref:MADF domain-containing protein n=1 Tax=Lithocarpus litseifolius TaxID=425828 RepID=A0AAW2E7P2_9ROSI
MGVFAISSNEPVLDTDEERELDEEYLSAIYVDVDLDSPDGHEKKCRHKMEKLRKRYRMELQRVRSMPVSRFISSWVHFRRMDAMEKAPSAKPRVNDSDSDENENNNDKGLDIENDVEEDQDLYEEFKNGGYWFG